MRLIDADANIKTMKKCAENPENEQALLCYRYAQRILEEAPTVELASPWHRAEEPPQEYGYYVVYRPYFLWTKAKYGWENGENHWYSLNGEILCPTYWMSIELPKEKE